MELLTRKNVLEPTLNQFKNELRQHNSVTARNYTTLMNPYKHDLDNLPC